MSKLGHFLGHFLGKCLEDFLGGDFLDNFLDDFIIKIDFFLQVITFSTVEDFWALHNHIENVSKLGNGCDYSLFKQVFFYDIFKKF